MKTTTRLLMLSMLLYGCTPDAEVGPADPEVELADEAAGQAVPVTSLSMLGPKRLRVTMVDVGQGDGLLVEFPGGKAMAVDGGPTNRRYADYLAARGVKRLDFAVLTHAHSDHFDGLPAAMELMPSDCTHRVVDPGYKSPLVSYGAFRAAAGCRLGSVGIGQTLMLDAAVQVRVMSAYKKPLRPDDSHGVNDTSVVLRLQYGKFSMLLTGDAETEAEQAEVAGGAAALRSTVLKLAHHGSCTASGTSFLKAVAPQHILISAATGNSYGLPHCQTMKKLAALKARGTRWHRTDLNGTVTVTTDGSGYFIDGERGKDSGAACPRDCDDPADF